MSIPDHSDLPVDRCAGLETVAGLACTGTTAGLKASGAPDLALVRVLGPEHTAAAVFTRNRFAAAPVLWSREVVSDGRADAVVLNSGGANACTGPEGFAAAHRTAEAAAEHLGIAAGDVLVCSTGLIGEQLPLEKLLAGLERACGDLASDEAHARAAARAIMTTDTVPKQAAHTSPEGWSVGGMAKGAGMLAPSLATMLVVLTTDADLDAAVPGAEFAPHLTRHGVAVTVVDLPVADGIAETLCDRARMLRADLIVAGAYRHSPIREFFFGGVTRALLRGSPAALFLAH